MFTELIVVVEYDSVLLRPGTRRIVFFEPDDVDAAIAELDRIHAEIGDEASTPSYTSVCGQNVSLLHSAAYRFLFVSRGWFRQVSGRAGSSPCRGSGGVVASGVGSGK